MKLSPYFLLLFLCYSCRAQERVTSIPHKDNKTTFLLDSAAAAHFILVDAFDRFFERVTPVEMSIQMHQPLPSGEINLPDMRNRFKSYLQSDMDSFSVKESRWVSEILTKVFETVHSVNPDIFPDSLILIKTKGNHYGDGVYYTRGKCIVIPADVLNRRDKSAFTSTMYHEIFHIYSRLHPEKRQALYSLIGFTNIGLDHLMLPSPLDERVLHNPDGVDYAQRITLQLSDTERADAIPIIYANSNGYNTSNKTFFSYLEFNLFKVEPAGDGNWAVITADDGVTSTLNLAQIPDFYKQIKDNTTYIIHPDEVLADNFSFIMLDLDGQQASIQFSKEGKALLKSIEQIIK